MTTDTLHCADCGKSILQGWQLEDGRTVCHQCCVADTGRIVNRYRMRGIAMNVTVGILLALFLCGAVMASLELWKFKPILIVYPVTAFLHFARAILKAK